MRDGTPYPCPPFTSVCPKEEYSACQRLPTANFRQPQPVPTSRRPDIQTHLCTMAACFNTVGRETTWDSRVHVPCNMTAVEAGGHSTCCAIGDLCLTNGLCMHKGDVDKTNWYWRTGCTDKTWEDPACPKYCAPIGESMKPVFPCMYPN